MAETNPLYQAPSVQYNPLQMAMQVQQLKNAQLANQTGQFSLDSQKAVGDAYQAATDPTTGQTDFNKLHGILSNSGQAGASKMPEIATNSIGQQQGKQSLTQAQFDLYQKQSDAVNKITTGIASDPNATPDQVYSQVALAIKNGAITPQAAAQGLSDLPGSDAPKGAIQAWAARHAAQSAGFQEQLKQMAPNYVNTGNGATNQVTDFNPNTAPSYPKQITVDQKLTPGQVVQPVSVYQNGQQGNISAGQFAAQTGNGALVGGPTAPVNQGGAATGNGRYPQQPQQAGQPAPAQPAGFVPTGAPVGQNELAAGGAQRVNTLQQAAASAPNQMHSYDLALEAAHGAVTGQGAGKIIDPQQILQTMGLGGMATGERVKDTQILNSQLASAADQAAASLGLAGSDARLQAAKAGQPNGEMNAPALIQQIKYVKGLQQGVVDKSNAYQAYLGKNGNNTANIGQFDSQFNKTFNPDVSYVRSLSNPADQQAEIAKLKQTGKYDAWRKSYVDMKALGAF